MIFPSDGSYASDSLFVQNDIYPGADVYPGTDVYPGVPGTVSQPAPDPYAPQTYVSSDGVLSVTLDPEASPPRAEITINWVGVASATLIRTDPNGETLPVRTAEPATLTSGAWSGFDYELPYGVGITYKLSAAGQTTEPSVITGVFNVPPAWRSALIQPAAPVLSVPIRLHEGTTATVTRAARRASLAVLNRARPIVVTDVRESRSAQLVIWCDTLDERDGLDSLIADGSALRLACDPRLGWDVPQCYVSIGDVTEARAVPGMPDVAYRIVTLPFLEVDRPVTAPPAGVVSVDWTYDQLNAIYTSYDQLNAAYANYANLDLNRPG